MENKYNIEVGKVYKWKSEDNSDFIVDKIEGNIAHYTYTSDNVPANGKLDSERFKEAILVKDKLDNVINPSHYNSTKITPFQVIDEWQLDFYLGNVIKYICRKDKKNNALEDLKKAQEYLKVAISKLENESK